VLHRNMPTWPLVDTHSLPSTAATECDARRSYVPLSYPLKLHAWALVAIPNRGEQLIPCRGLCRYIRSSQHIHRTLHWQQPRASFFAKLLAPLRSKRVPRIAMFGQGLESSTSGIVNELMWGERTPFQVAGLVPGVQGRLVTSRC
jgi:hypothetical protein